MDRLINEKYISNSVLDKIRDEIEKIPTAPFATAYTAKCEVLRIIDKARQKVRIRNEDRT